MGNTREKRTVGNVFVDNPRMTCRNVNVFYGLKQAIFDVSLDIGENEVIALIGPIFGKSTHEQLGRLELTSNNQALRR